VSGYRSEIEAFAGPAREGLVGGGMRLLVRVRLFDDPHPEGPLAPEAFTDLRPETARDLAFCLLAAAEDAERQTEQAAFWEQAR